VPRTPSDWITLQEATAIFAAANVSISPSTLARWARDGKLQTIRIGRRIYVRRGQIRAALQPPRRGVPLRSLQGRLFDE
jgi:hypothetical protein